MMDHLTLKEECGPVVQKWIRQNLPDLIEGRCAPGNDTCQIGRSEIRGCRKGCASYYVGI